MPPARLPQGEAEGLLPNEAIYEALVRHLCSQGDPDGGEGILQQMKASGLLGARAAARAGESGAAVQRDHSRHTGCSLLAAGPRSARHWGPALRPHHPRVCSAGPARECVASPAAASRLPPAAGLAEGQRWRCLACAPCLRRLPPTLCSPACCCRGHPAAERGAAGRWHLQLGPEAVRHRAGGATLRCRARLPPACNNAALPMGGAAPSQPPACCRRPCQAQLERAGSLAEMLSAVQHMKATMTVNGLQPGAPFFAAQLLAAVRLQQVQVRAGPALCAGCAAGWAASSDLAPLIVAGLCGKPQARLPLPGCRCLCRKPCRRSALCSACPHQHHSTLSLWTMQRSRSCCWMSGEPGGRPGKPAVAALAGVSAPSASLQVPHCAPDAPALSLPRCAATKTCRRSCMSCWQPCARGGGPCLRRRWSQMSRASQCLERGCGGGWTAPWRRG